MSNKLLILSEVVKNLTMKRLNT